MAGRINKNKVIAAAQKYVQKGQHARAIREYQKVVDDDPREVRIWLKIGDLYAKKGDKQNAVDTYLKVAEFYAEQGFYLKAVAVHKQVLKLNPDLLDVNLKLAELYKQLGLLNDAMQQYEVVANYYTREGRTRDALTAVRQIVDLDPENVASRIKLAELYSREEMRDEAIEEFSKASDYLRTSNRIDDFIKVAERLVFHQPDNVSVTKELASLYLRREDPRRALQKLQAVFKADPRDEDTLGMLAQAFEGLGQTSKTVSVLKELAQVQLDKGLKKKHKETLERIIALSPDDPEVCQALGRPIAGAPAPAPAPAVPPPASPAPPPVVATAAPAQTRPSPPQVRPPPAEFSPASLPGPMVGQVEIGPPPGVDLPAAPAGPVAVGDGSDVTRILAEADVYTKYGLHDKAVEHLRRIFEHEPANVEARLRLRDILVETGQIAEASQELCALAAALVHTDRRAALQHLREAVEIDPSNQPAARLLSQLDRSSGTPTGEGDFDDEADTGLVSFEEEDSAIYLDLDDIVEEVPIDSEGPATLQSPGAALSPAAVLLDPLDDYGEDSGVLEVRGEAAAARQGQAPSPAAEVIPLPLAPNALVERVDVAETADASSAIEDELDEADFFIQQNLFDEARAIVEELAKQHPQHSLVVAKLAELDDLTGRAEPAAAPADDPQPRATSTEDELDITSQLAAELAAELDGLDLQLQEADIPAEGSEYSVEDVFDEFKRGVGDQVSEEDSETHYDLGLAYREMGLVEDAITEFQIAMKSPEREVLCHMMIGLCYADQQRYSDAIAQFKSGLYVEGIEERQSTALYFELGHAYEQLSDPQEALFYYEKVSRRDPGFRDVAERIARLKPPGSAGAAGEHSARSI